MSAHAAHQMHDNSLATYRAEETKLSRRALAVLAWVKDHGPHTDRGVMVGMGFADMNSVRPRITELIDANKLMEVAHRPCPVTGKRVRVIDIRRPRQGALFA